MKVVHHPADLSDVIQIEALFNLAEREFGGVDILVNNAGIQHVAPVEQFPPESWDKIIALNLSAVFHGTRLALPGMRTRNWGASSISLRCMAWSARWARQPTWQPSMVWSA